MNFYSTIVLSFVMCVLNAGFYDSQNIIKHQIHSLSTATDVNKNAINLKNPDPNRKQIPILCYHNIKPGNKQIAMAYTINQAEFRSHMKMLSDSGYHTILPDQLYEYLTLGIVLPLKPIIISFDDTHEEHFSIAAPVLNSFGYKGVFFIMAVSIEKRFYLTTSQIKILSDSGHVIGCHTWDHQNVKKLEEKEWDIQITGPKIQLEKITARPVQYFAYPYGAWNENAIHELKKRGIKAAFQLSDRQSEKEPLYTIRRLMVSGNWTATVLNKRIHTAFQP